MVAIASCQAKNSASETPITPTAKQTLESVEISQAEIFEHIKFIEKNVTLPPLCGSSFGAFHDECLAGIFLTGEFPHIQIDKNEYVRYYTFSPFKADEHSGKIIGRYMRKPEDVDKQTSVFIPVPGHEDVFLLQKENMPYVHLEPKNSCAVINVAYDIEKEKLLTARIFRPQWNSDPASNVEWVDRILVDGTVLHGSCGGD